MKKYTVADRVDRAASRAEDAIAALLRNAENWTLQNRSLWDIQNHRKELLTAARSYARAMNALTRARR